MAYDPPTGRLVQVYSGSVGETLLVSLSLGIKRFNVTATGVTATDKIVAASAGAPSAGCALVDAYATGTNTVSVGTFVPALGIGATYAIPVTLYKVT